MASEKAVIDVGSLQPIEFGSPNSTRFGGRFAEVATILGLEGLGCRYFEVKPGQRAFPYHNHLGNDELFIILDGQGVYRYGDQEIAITAGSVCGAPKGGQEGAHQIINNSTDELKYLAISTLNDPDICEYPDSNKILAIGIKPGKDFRSAYLKYIGPMDNQVDYYYGEED